MSDEEKDNLWSEFSTANIRNKSRVNPTVFTEQGVYMLVTILRSKVAIEVTINIMDAFVLMNNYISSCLIENNYYKEMLLSHDRHILYH